MAIELIKGFKQFAAQIDDLNRNIDAQILRNALRAGGIVFREAIRENIQTLPLSDNAKRTLRRGLFLKVDRTKDRQGVVAELRFKVNRPPRSKKGAEGKAVSVKVGDPYWWHWVEYGTATRTTRRGWARGSVKPHPFVEPAIRNAEEKAYNAIRDKIDEEIEKRILGG